MTLSNRFVNENVPKFYYDECINPKFRLNYVHRMAMFKLLTQVKKQTAAFIEGFHSLVEPSLIEYFSPQELQRLISGDDTDIDVDDLR